MKATDTKEKGRSAANADGPSGGATVPRSTKRSTPARQARATQRDRIRAALYAGAEMTAVSALREEGCVHLASRISELVAEGCPVKKKWALVDSAYGGAARVVVYYVDPADRPVSAP